MGEAAYGITEAQLPGMHTLLLQWLRHPVFLPTVRQHAIGAATYRMCVWDRVVWEAWGPLAVLGADTKLHARGVTLALEALLGCLVDDYHTLLPLKPCFKARHLPQVPSARDTMSVPKQTVHLKPSPVLTQLPSAHPGQLASAAFTKSCACNQPGG